MERTFHFDYTLQLTERSRSDLDAFWPWYRADNALMTSLTGHEEVQRVFVPRVGPTNTILERIEVSDFAGIGQYFVDLSAAKARVKDPAGRLEEFYRWIEISELRVRGEGPSFDRIERGEYKVFVTEAYRYRHSARSRIGDFWNAIASVDESLKQQVEGLRGVQNYTELIGAHWEFSRWLAFDDVLAANTYLAASSAESGQIVSTIYEWAEPVSSSIIEEVPNV